jgi:hypothetical protein
MQSNEHAFCRGAANPGCRRLLAGVYRCDDADHHRLENKTLIGVHRRSTVAEYASSATV